MGLRWTEGAARDLETIATYLFENTPLHAPRLVHSIYGAVTTLTNFPNRGRKGKMAGTRELVLPSLPYVVVYEVTGDAIYVVRILHGAQEWPD